MSEVLIDDLNLNKIANSIRRKNGLVRTYKPREMAPAIRAFRNFIPSTHEFVVTINQSPHQLITAKRYLNVNRTNYTNTFTVSEPFYMMELSIVPDGGYEEGTLNYESPVVIDRDMVISATPATPIGEATGWKTFYVDGRRVNPAFSDYSYMQLYKDDDLQQPNNYDEITGKIIVHGTNGDITSFNRFLGGTFATNSRAKLVYKVYTDVDTSNVSDFSMCLYGCNSLQTINVETWDTGNATSFYQLFMKCNSLKYVNVANWNVNYVTDMRQMFAECSALFSLDLSGWETSRLRTASGMFDSCIGLVALDISGWKTTNIESISMPPNVKYIIMDDDSDIKFKGNYAMPDPNNYVKYLVPSTMVTAYREHQNWSGRSSRIVDIGDYTIIRYNGEVEVTKNDDD